MKKLRAPIAALSIAVMLTAGTAPAHACKCARIPYDKVVADTPVVFDGEVVRSERDVKGLQQITSFRVRSVVKGLPRKMVMTFNNVLKRTPQRTVTVVSVVNDAECGWDFAAGPQRLIVGADRDPDGLLTATRCTMYNLNTPP